MKNIFSIALLVLLVSSCKEEKKQVELPENNLETQVENTTASQIEYPKLTGVPSELNYIFDNGFEFSDNIKLNYIALLSKGDNKYQLIYGLNKDSNIEYIEKLKISAVFYAEDPTLFKDEIYRKRKARQVPLAIKINSLDNEPVISQEFTLIPKVHTQVKFYFYGDNGVENDKMLTIRKIKMPQ